MIGERMGRRQETRQPAIVLAFSRVQAAAVATVAVLVAAAAFGLGVNVGKQMTLDSEALARASGPLSILDLAEQRRRAVASAAKSQVLLPDAATAPTAPAYTFETLEADVPVPDLKPASGTDAPPKPADAASAKTEIPEPAKPEPAARPHCVQFGFFSVRSDAEEAQAALKGLKVTIVEVTVTGKQAYRLRTGPYPSKEKAAAALPIVAKKSGRRPVIVPCKS